MHCLAILINIEMLEIVVVAILAEIGNPYEHMADKVDFNIKWNKLSQYHEDMISVRNLSD